MTIGRPIATTEPNVISRMTIAASNPIPVAVPSAGCSACWIAWPPSSTWSCGESAAWATEITFLASAWGTSKPRRLKFTSAKAILPSREI